MSPIAAAQSRFAGITPCALKNPWANISVFRKADHYLKFFLSDFNLLKITASRFLMFQTSFSYLKVCCQALVSSYLTDYDWLSIYIGKCRHIWPHNLPTYKINLDTAVNAWWREKKELSEKNSHETWSTIGSWFTAMLKILPSRYILEIIHRETSPNRVRKHGVQWASVTGYKTVTLVEFRFLASMSFGYKV